MIECKVTAVEIATHPHAELLIGGYIADKLRKAGIPAKGILYFAGVRSGTLYETRDFNGDLNYFWTEKIQ